MASIEELQASMDAGKLVVQASGLVVDETNADEPQEIVEEGGVLVQPGVSSPKPKLTLADPPSLWLSEEETDNALAIKDAIEGLPDLDNLNDFMYAHMAIAGKGNLEWAIERAYKLQAVKQEYKILGTYEEGIREIKKDMETHKGMVMAYNFNPHDGKVELIMDITKWDMKAWRNPHLLEQGIRNCYYFCHATFPSFESIRVGNIHVFECEGFDWKKNMVDLKTFGKISDESHGSFPSHLQQTRFFHTPMLMNVLVSMVKRLIPKDLHDSFKVGCQFAGGRLDKFYLLPTPEIALERAYANVCESLRIRYECERRFSLDDD